MVKLNLKERILKSGIPLEASVLKLLAPYKFHDWGEVEYTREGVVFSTDINLSTSAHIAAGFGLYINYVIECKYKSCNHTWYFFKFKNSSDDYAYTRSEGGNLASSGRLKGYLGSRGFPLSKVWFDVFDLDLENIFDLPEVHKGVDVNDNDSEEKSIHEAISQVTFASIKTHLDSDQYNLDMLETMLIDDWLEPIDDELEMDQLDIFDLDAKVDMDDPDTDLVDLTNLTVPIIVTTADIRVIEDNVTLEEIEKCNDVLELSKEVPGVALINNNPEKYSSFRQQCIDQQGRKMEQHFINWYGKLPYYHKSVIDHPCHREIPGFIYVINYKHLLETFNYGHSKIVQIANKIEGIDRGFEG